MTKKFTPSTKATYLEQFHQSGLTQAVFCRQQGLILKTFNNWLRQMRAAPNMAVLSDSPLVDLSPAMPSTVDSDQTMNPCQNGIGTSNANQATFIPIHLNNTPLCAPSSHQPPEPDCSAISPRTSSKSVFHQSVLGFKTNRFSLDVSLDLSTKYGQDALKSVIQMLHQLADGQDSYD